MAASLNPHALLPNDRLCLEGLLSRLEEFRPRNIGYPCNQDFDISELLPLPQYSLNNVGDPFRGSNYRLNTLDFERDVVAKFAKLTHTPVDHCWGYVTNGGTEGNMYGLDLAREIHPDGNCYFSEEKAA